MHYKIKNGSITLNGNTILEDINFTINDHEKIGLVGRNGTGKTTFLKALIGEIELSDGYEKLEIEKTNDFKIGYIKQNLIENYHQQMEDYIKNAYQEIITLEKDINKVEKKLAEEYTDKTLENYNKLINSYKLMGGYTYKKEYEQALKKFGFTEVDKKKTLEEFSGGQLTKLTFLRLILSKPDLLILDEPTNHLDINTIEWLEEYLKNYPKSIILVSHDQMFLDNICNVIYDIEYGTLKRYKGNYQQFLIKKQEDYEKQLKDYEAQQKEIKRLQSIADRFKYKPSKAKMALSKLKKIEQMTIIDKPQKENKKTFKINFDPEKESYKEVLKIKNLSIGYDKELANVTLTLTKGEKLGIIGANGTGKSTFLKTLLGEVKQLSGKYSFGNNVNIAYFSQQQENLDKEKTVYEEINKSFPDLSPNSIRNLLGTFEFTKDDVFKEIKNLSGGEKVKLSLCKILYLKPNLLILDEPTNHLDLVSKKTIEDMLKKYKGTLIIVSHDRHLISNICDKLLVFNFNSAKLYQYSYQEYLEKRNLEELTIEKNIKKEKAQNNNITYSLNKEIAKVERKITKLEKQLKDKEAELYKKEIYENLKKVQDIQKEIVELTKNLEQETIKWENLIDKVENI